MHPAALQHPAINRRTRHALLRASTFGQAWQSRMRYAPALELKQHTSGSGGEAVHPSTRTPGFRRIGTILTGVLRSMGLR